MVEGTARSVIIARWYSEEVTAWELMNRPKIMCVGGGEGES